MERKLKQLLELSILTCELYMFASEDLYVFRHVSEVISKGPNFLKERDVCTLYKT